MRPRLPGIVRLAANIAGRCIISATLLPQQKIRAAWKTETFGDGRDAALMSCCDTSYSRQRRAAIPVAHPRLHTARHDPYDAVSSAGVRCVRPHPPAIPPHRVPLAVKCAGVSSSLP